MPIKRLIAAMTTKKEITADALDAAANAEVSDEEDVESNNSGSSETESEEAESSVESTVDDQEGQPRAKRARVVKRRPVFSDKIPAIPVAAFKRLVREVTNDQKLKKDENILWEAQALEALQVGAEAFVIDRFYEAQKRSVMCRKKTVGVGHFG